MSDFKIEKREIKVQEYLLLRSLTDWSAVTENQMKLALSNDLFAVCILSGQQTIGIGRIIGDGAIYYYIQDVIVHPDFRKRGVGRIIMKELLEFLVNRAAKGSFIGLMAAKGTEVFYREFGFKPRNKNSPGMFKIL